jgi:hypothetical protein
MISVWKGSEWMGEWVSGTELNAMRGQWKHTLSTMLRIGLMVFVEATDGSIAHEDIV